MRLEPCAFSEAPNLWRLLGEKPWLGPLLSAILLALAFAGLWPLVFIALVPWLLSLREVTPRQAWNRGYAFGLLFSLSQLWWLGQLAYTWTGSALLGLVPWILAALLSAVYYGLLGRLVRSCGLLGAAWAIPLVWAGMEVFRSYLPVFAFPWALLAEPLVGTPLRGLAWFGTIYLVSAAVVAVNLAVAARSVRRLAALAAGGAFLLTLWAGVFRRTIDPLGRRDVVAAGQPGVDMAVPDEGVEERIAPSVDALVRDATQRGADVLVLPEGITLGGPAIPPHTGFRIPAKPALVFGGQRGSGPVYQSAYAHANGRWSYADKTRLVIFGEFVPGRDVLPFLQAFHLPSGDLSAGDKLKGLDVGGLRVGPLICFEALFPDLAFRQAALHPDFLAVMSIDDWFRGSPAPARLADASRWRATETGLPLVRAGSLGRTMILNAQGAVLQDAPYGGRRLVVAALEKGHGPFPIAWLFPAAALGSLIAVPFAARRRRTLPRGHNSAHEQTSIGRPD